MRALKYMELRGIIYIVLVGHGQALNNWIELYNDDSFKTKKEKIE